MGLEERFRKCYGFMVKNCRLKDYLDHLFGEGTITQTEKENIDSAGTDFEKNRRILDYLYQKGNGAIKTFLEEVKKREEYLYTKISTTEDTQEKEESDEIDHTEEQLKEKIRRNREDIIKRVTEPVEIADALFSNYIIDFVELESIKSEASKTRKTCAILDTLSKKNKGFKQFLEELSEGNEQLQMKIKQTVVDHKESQDAGNHQRQSKQVKFCCSIDTYEYSDDLKLFVLLNDDQSKKHELLKHETIENMWIANVEVSIHDTHTYVYEVVPEVKRKFLRAGALSQKEEKVRYLQDNVVCVRDVLMDCKYNKCIISHCLDILSCKEEKDLADFVQELDMLFYNRSLKCTWKTVQTFLTTTPTSRKRKAIIVAIMSYYSNLHEEIQDFEPEVCESLLNGFENQSFDEIPKERKRKMNRVLIMCLKRFVGKEASVIHLILYVYPFFNENELYALLDDKQCELKPCSEMLWGKAEMKKWYDGTERCINLLCRRVLQKKADSNWVYVLKNILLHLPLELLVKCWTLVLAKFENENEFLKRIDEVEKVVHERHIEELNAATNIKKCVEFVENLDERLKRDLNPKIQDKALRCFIEILCLQDPCEIENACGEIKYLCKHHELFRERNMQHSLLNALARSPHGSCRDLFLDLVQAYSFIKITAEELERLFDACFKTYVETNTVVSVNDIQSMVLQMDQWIQAILKLGLAVELQEQLCSRCRNLLFTSGNKLIKDALKLTWKTESAENLFHMQLKELVQRGQLQSKTIIEAVTSSTVIANSRGKVELLLVLAEEDIREHFQHDCNVHVVLNIVEKKEFWKSILFNIRGKEMTLIEENKLMREIISKLKAFIEELQENKTDFRTFKQLRHKQKDLEDIYDNLEMKHDFSHVMDNMEKTIQKITNWIDEASCSVQSLNKQICNFIIQSNFNIVEPIEENSQLVQCCNFIFEYLEEQKNMFETGTTDIAEVLKKDFFHSDGRIINELKSCCLALSSSVFININTCTLTICLEQIQNQSSTHIRQSARYSTVSDEIFIDQMPNDGSNQTGYSVPVNIVISQIQEFLSCVLVTCLEKYSKEMKILSILSATRKIPMQQVRYLFKDDGSMSNEIEIAKRLINMQFKERNEQALLQLEKLQRKKKNIKLIKDLIDSLSVKPFDFSHFLQMYTPVENVLNEELEGIYLEDISTCLEYLFSLVQTTYFNRELANQDDRLQGAETRENTITKLLEIIGYSTELFRFLHETIDEDFRNFMDAIHECLDITITESVVSSLIDVQHYMKPVLQLPESCDVDEILQLLFGEKNDLFLTAIPRKFTECSDNLSGILSLYTEMTSKGDRLDYLIEAITADSRVRFSKSKTGYTFAILCADSQTRPHFATEILDMKSQALLVIGTKEKVNLGVYHTFVDTIDHAFDIIQTLEALEYSGHVDYSNFETEIETGDLKSLLGILKNEYESWNVNIEKTRNSCRFINYFTGRQLSELKSALKNRDAFTMSAKLKYVNSRIKLSDIEESIVEVGNTEYVTYDTVERFIGVVLNRQTFSQRVLSLQSNELNTIFRSSFALLLLKDNEQRLLPAVLSVYSKQSEYFPDVHQIVFCNKQTSWEEIDLLLRRCLHDCTKSESSPLYCIALTNLLNSKTQEMLITRLGYVLQTQKQDLPLVLIDGGGKDTRLARCFSDYEQEIELLSNEDLKLHLKDICSHITVVTSDRPGLGKTEFIHSEGHRTRSNVTTIQLNGQINIPEVIDTLSMSALETDCVIHFDVGVTDNCLELDILFFQICLMNMCSYNTKYFALTCSSFTIFIEISNTIKDTLLRSFSTLSFLKKKHIIWHNFDNFIISKDLYSREGIIYKYLFRKERGLLDSEDVCNEGKVLDESNFKRLLKAELVGLESLSFTSVHIFLSVLAEQLHCLENSTFFQTKYFKRGMIKTQDEEFININTDVSIAMINMAKTFATNFFTGVHSLQEKAILDDANEYLAQREKHMIRWESIYHLFIVFHARNKQKVDLMYKNIDTVPVQLRDIFEGQGSELKDLSMKTSKERQAALINICRLVKTPFEESERKALQQTFSLTNDNLLKMTLISMRIRAHVPVIITGETGCGKTSLIRYIAKISGVPLEIFNIHAGRERKDIIQKIQDCDKKARNNLEMPLWLFLDEINTNENVGLLCDVLCSHILNGIQLAPNLTIIGACNPYRTRVHGPICTKGLTGKIKHDAKSKLVYRVHPLPEKVFDFLWDFGKLSDRDEKDYISVMVQNCLNMVKDQDFQTLFAILLEESQRFFRSNQDTEITVSLRDIERCKHLADWFISDYFEKKNISISNGTVLKALVLSLAQCYLFRITNKSEREAYLEALAKCLRSVGGYENTNKGELIEIIKDEQHDLLKRMHLPPGIAANGTLLENVFVMIVSILNKIPLFLIGKPGCSKSLSMQLIRNSLKGRESDNDLFKKWPQVIWKSFQGTETSSSEDIIKVFESARRIRENLDNNTLPLVVLDEIGLAEISPFNPLKVLHELLEPDGNPYSDVAIVGISNWTLDPAKMSRAVHVSCQDLNLEDMIKTAKCITNIERESTGNTFMPFEAIAKAFEEIQTDSSDHFYGLRDFYSLIQYMHHHIRDTSTDDDISQHIFDGILRNFGGSQTRQNQVIKVFQKYMKFECDTTMSKTVDDLVKENVLDKHSRHLMIILNGDSAVNQIGHILEESNRQFMILLGSNFDLDQSNDYNYRVLNQVILCMERGNVLVLKDLDNIYGSLYDMLNQNFTIFAKQQHCRVALGPYNNPLCFVHEDFRCIVIMEQQKICTADPPFLNRFEKQEFCLYSLLNESQQQAYHLLSKCFSQMYVNEQDIIGIYEDLFLESTSSMSDLLSSLILYVQTLTDKDPTSDEFRNICLLEILKISKPEFVFNLRLTTFGKQNPKKAGELLNVYLDSCVHDGLQSYIDEIVEEEQDFFPAYEFMPIENNTTEDILLQENFNIQDQTCPRNLHFQKHRNLHIIFTHDESLSISKTFADICFVSHLRSKREMEEHLERLWVNGKKKGVLIAYMNAEKDIQHLNILANVVENMQKADNASDKKIQICLVIYIPRNKNMVRLSKKWNFLTKWCLVYLDSLYKPRENIPYLFNKSIPTILQKRGKDFLKEICNNLPAVLRRIKFPVASFRSVNDIQGQLETLQVQEELLELFRNHIIKWNINEDDVHWIISVVSDQSAMQMASSLTYALECHITEKIRDALAVLVFELLQCGWLDSIQAENATSEKWVTWKTHFLNPQIFHITDALYHHIPVVLQIKKNLPVLQTPFFNLFVDTVERKQNAFKSKLNDLMATFEISDCVALPIKEVTKIALSFEGTINDCLKDLLKHQYERLHADYTHDFFVFVATKCFDRNAMLVSVEVVEQLFCSLKILDPPYNNLASHILCLHTTLWVYFSYIMHILDLLNACQVVNKTNPLSILQQALQDVSETISMEELISNILKAIFPQKMKLQAFGELRRQFAHFLNISKPLCSKMSIFQALYFCYNLSACLPDNLESPIFMEIVDSLIHRGCLLTEISNKIWFLFDTLRTDHQVDQIILQHACKLYIKLCFELRADHGREQVEGLVRRIHHFGNFTFEPSLSLFGPILEMALRTIDNDFLKDDILKYATAKSSYVESQELVKSIDSFLQVSNIETPFSSILVQVLQRTMRSFFERSNEMISMIARKASDLIKTAERSLLLYAATAYLKLFLKHVVCKYNESGNTALFSVLRNIIEMNDKRHDSLRLYFHRILGQEGIVSFQNRIAPFVESQACNQFPFDESKVKSIAISFEMRPLVYFVHSLVKCKQEFDLDELSTTLRNVNGDLKEEIQSVQFEYRLDISKKEIEILNNLCENDRLIKSICKTITADIEGDGVYLGVFIIHVFISVICSNSKENIWYLMMFDSKRLNGKFIPGHGVEGSGFCKPFQGINVFMCSNNHRYTVDFEGSVSSNLGRSKCPICKTLPIFNSENPLIKSTPPQKGLTGVITDNQEKTSYTTGNLTPVAFRILQLLNSSCIICSNNFQYTHDIKNDSTTHALAEKSFLCHWNVLKKMLLTSNNELGKVLQMIISKLTPWFIEKCQIENTSDRENWEKAFSKKIHDTLKQREKLLHQEIKEYYMHQDVDEMLFDLDDSVGEHSADERELKSNIYQIYSEPTINHVFTCLTMLDNPSLYPVLSIVMENPDILILPRYILPIVRWHNATRQYLKDIVTVEDKSITLRKLVRSQLKPTKEIRKAFSSFKSSMKGLKAYEEEFQSFSSRDISIFDPDLGDTLQKLLIFSKESILYQIIEVLSSMQNKFIDNVLKAAAFLHCPSTSFINCLGRKAGIRCILITDVTPEDIVDFEITKTFLEENCQHGTTATTGRRIEYDFQQMELTLSYHALYGKAYLSKLESLLDSDFCESHNSTIESILESIFVYIPQSPIHENAKMLVNAITMDTPSKMRQLMNLLEIVFSVLQQHRNREEIFDGKMSLESFIKDNRIEYLTFPKLQIPLESTVYLYKYLEELRGRDIILKLPVSEFIEQSDAKIIENAMIKFRPSLQHLCQACCIFAGRTLSTNPDFQFSSKDPYGCSLHDCLCMPQYWCDGCNVCEGNADTNNFIEAVDCIIPGKLTVRQIKDFYILLQKKIQCINQL